MEAGKEYVGVYIWGKVRGGCVCKDACCMSAVYRVFTDLLLWHIDAAIASFSASERPAFSQWVTNIERIMVGPILLPVCRSRMPST